MFVIATPPQTRLPQGSRVFSAAADGYLMLRTPRKTVLLAPLLDDGSSVFESPQREDDEGFMCCAPPQHDDEGSYCNDPKVFAVYPELDAIKIQSWDGQSWRSFHNSGKFFKTSFSCNPVMHRGKLYCLGQAGNLGVYDPGKVKWRVLPKPASFGSEFQYKNCYLVESQGELLAALTGGNSGMPAAIHVLRLNEKKMNWERMESLGGRSLFTGTASSLSMARPPQSMANKVFLPRFYGRPQVIHAELASSAGRLFFVAKEAMPKKDEDGGGAWCYDLDSDFHRPFAGASCKNLLQHVWVHLGRVASPRNDLMVIG
jgi:hypothetical protein